MEGTRHERAALVGVAYFLGFLTTFIWLGVNKQVTPLEEVMVSPSQSASVASAVLNPETSDTSGSVPVEQADAVTYNNGLLEMTALGKTRVLSFNPEVAGIAVTEDFMTQGVHVGEVIFTASPTDEFVFFCEQKALDAKTCLPFVYDSLTEKIYPLRKDGDRVELLVSAAVEAFWQGNQLSVGGELSPDPQSPWLLGR